MKLVRFHEPGRGPRLGMLDGEQVIDVTEGSGAGHSLAGLLEQAAQQRESVAAVVTRARAMAKDSTHSYTDLDVAPAPDRAHLLSPIDSPEVWAFGVTYRRSADFREDDMQTGKGIYDMVYDAPRPEAFYKGDTKRTVGPNAAGCIRADSAITVPEAELALVLGARGEIVGYTICDDISAWDIERENPLYLPQSKIYYGSCVLGPIMVTSDELTDARGLQVRCVIKREGTTIFDESVGTDRIKRSFQELIDCLRLNNPIPVGTVISTGTGVIVPPEQALREGDVVEITIDQIGTLRHTMTKLPRDSH